MSTTYKEKLKDPRWQKRRLEIFSRDNWACTRYKDTTSILHIHHKEYIQGHNPWDYPDPYLITLCESCHKQGHAKSVFDRLLLAPTQKQKKLLGHRHPKWQKLRLEVMAQAQFACENCGSGDKPLEIHHPYYVKGLAPWEYPPYCLEVLCWECHGNHHELCRHCLNHGVERHPNYKIFWEKLVRDNPGWGVEELAKETRRLVTLRLQHRELPFWVLPDQLLPWNQMRTRWPG